MSNDATRNDPIEDERRRVNTYKLLAECYQQPDDDLTALLTETSNDEVTVDVETLCATAPAVDELRTDHAQLFVGPFELSAPPYESTYVDDPDRVMTEATVAVEGKYRRAGFDVAIDEPADHVAVELEFVYVLALQECEALVSGDREKAAEAIEQQYEFLAEHLGRWVSEFATNVREHATTDFYRELADETQSFVENDGKQLRDRIERLDSEDDVVDAIVGGDHND